MDHFNLQENFMLVLLNLTAEQVRDSDPHLAGLFLSGDLREAVAYGKRVLDSEIAGSSIAQRACVGRVVGACLLRLGREVEAEELFQRQHRLYSQMSCDDVRRLASLDQSVMTLWLHRLGRAAQSATCVIDDVDAPVALRVEALGLLAESLYQLGEFESANWALEHAADLATQAQLVRMAQTAHLLQLDQHVRRFAQPSAGNGERASCLCVGATALSACGGPEALRDALASAVVSFSGNTLVLQRIDQLRLLLDVAQGQASAQGRVVESAAWVVDRGMSGAADRLRIEAALACLRGKFDATAGQVLQPVVGAEGRTDSHRFAVVLHYCMARLHESGGRLSQALVAYSNHATASTRLLRTELSRASLPRCLAQHREAKADGADVLRLPARYKPAYRFIIDHLADSSLNVALVAAHAGVTARMLQMVFREHLGVTPAALIRKLRMQRIQEDLSSSVRRKPVEELASKWGIMSRSTASRGLRAAVAAAA
jgi:AraC-like DNA-binding protein